MINILSICWVFYIPFVYSQKEKNIPVESNYALITMMYSKNNKDYLEADYVLYFTGKNAIDEAKKRGKADKRVVNGQTVYSVPDDIFIVNENNKIRKLEVSSNLKLNYFKKDYNDKLFLLTIQKKKVTEIKEIFTP